MSNRTWIVIVVFGVGAVVLLGMSMQFVVESSPGLQETIKFKQALARDFASRGIQEVALRNLKERSGYHLLLTAVLPESEADRERLDEEVADYFVREHGNRRAQALRISYHPPRSWGFRTALAEPHRVRDIPLSPLRQRIARVEKEKQLAVYLDEQFHCELISCELEGTELAMRIRAPAARTPSDARNLARQIERDARGRLRGFYSTLRLILVTAPQPAAGLEKSASGGPEQGTTAAAENVVCDHIYDARGTLVHSGGRSAERSVGTR